MTFVAGCGLRIERHFRVASNVMGPREALAQIIAIIKQAKASHDLEEIHRLLREMETVAQTAIGKGTLRQGRRLRLLHQR
jgi:hypothetical protein